MIGIIKADVNKDVDKSIGDFSSPEVMRKNGWKIDAVFQYDPRYLRICGNETWYGYNFNHAVGSVKIAFLGNGKATLNFGNCFTNGFVIVYLNDQEISRANRNVRSKEVKFNFSKRDVLTIKELNIAIIKLNSLKIVNE